MCWSTLPLDGPRKLLKNIVLTVINGAVLRRDLVFHVVVCFVGVRRDILILELFSAV